MMTMQEIIEDLNQNEAKYINSHWRSDLQNKERVSRLLYLALQQLTDDFTYSDVETVCKNIGVTTPDDISIMSGEFQDLIRIGIVKEKKPTDVNQQEKKYAYKQFT